MSDSARARRPKPAFVDSNLLVHAYDEQAPSGVREPALELVQACFEGRMKLAVSNQVLGEMVHTMTKAMRRRIPERDPMSIAEDLIQSTNWVKCDYTSSTLLAAGQLRRKHRIPFWDSVLVATILENGLTKIYTQNESDFAPVTQLEVVNPISAPSEE